MQSTCYLVWTCLAGPLWPLDAVPLMYNDVYKYIIFLKIMGLGCSMYFASLACLFTSRLYVDWSFKPWRARQCMGLEYPKTTVTTVHFKLYRPNNVRQYQSMSNNVDSQISNGQKRSRIFRFISKSSCPHVAKCTMECQVQLVTMYQTSAIA